MAFGWKTEFEKRVSLDGLTKWQVFAIAEQACKDLDWDYLVADESTFTATTPTNWTLNEEIITIQVDKDEIIFKSKSESLELLEAGRNQRNIEEELVPAFNKVKSRWSAEGLTEAATTLQRESLKQLSTGSRVESEKLTYGFHDHEITFSLIAIKLIVFVAMIIRGVNMSTPATADILKWGGAMRPFVTGGEWWRLAAAIFLHIGTINLIADIIALYFIGILVESILGKVKFLIAFLCAGILANLITVIWNADVVAAGSSGAIFGMYGVFLAFATTRYITRKFPKVWLLTILAYIAFSIFIGYGTQVYNVINFSGLVAGIVIGYLFYFFHFKRNVARAGGTRISIEILLVTALVAFLYIRNQRDDSIRFEKAVMRLNQIELKAMTQMQRLQNYSDEQATKMLKDTTLPEWQHFQKELVKTDKYHLDNEFTEKRKLLNKYAQLRILQTQLIYESIKQGTDKFNNNINVVSDSIEVIIDRLGY
jgi:rhomboid protease GluP